MPDETIAYLDLTNCSRPYDLFARIHKAFGFAECGFNWSAVYDFICTETPVETLYITGEASVSPDLQEFAGKLHSILEDVNQFRLRNWDTPFVVHVLS